MSAPAREGGPSTSSDCSRCFGLCCVALPFARSADFPVDKPAGMPCGHLRPDHSCGTHASLLAQGYRGCTVFECFGAGQQVSQVTFRGQSWRDNPATAASMFAVFPVVQGLHEMLRHLDETLSWELPGGVASAAAGLRDEVVSRTTDGPDLLLALDLGELRSRVGAVLGEASAAVRGDERGGPGTAGTTPAGKRRDPRLRRGADLLGARLHGVDARGADLRGALLIAADLRGADLRHADLLGADLRDADVRGADLSTALYLTQPQVNAARGDAATRIPEALDRPGPWAS